MIKLLIINKIKRNYLIEHKNIMKITKRDCKSKQKISIENYLTKKKIKKENMNEIDIKIC